MITSFMLIYLKLVLMLLYWIFAYNWIATMLKILEPNRRDLLCFNVMISQ